MAEREEDNELDSILTRSFGPADSLAPSSGFVAAVMGRIQTERVRQDAGPALAYVPAPIAFPWRRALPGVCLAMLAVAAAAALLLNYAWLAVTAVSATAPSPAMRSAELFAHGLGVRAVQLPLGWLGVALVLALLPLVITREMMQPSRMHSR